MNQATPTSEFVIMGVGARSSIGLNALQTTMGIRAGVLRPADTHFKDSLGESTSMISVSCVPPTSMGMDRLVALARPALLEAAAEWRRFEAATRGKASPLPLVIAVPGVLVEDSPFGRVNRFLEKLGQAAGEVIDPARCVQIVGGRAAGVAALERALQLLAEGADAVLVGGVDTYFDSDRLDALAAELRLHGPETEDGFIPGEAAAFVLLSRTRNTSSLRSYACILGHALEQEPRPFGSEEPCHGLGMTAALRKAASAVGPRRLIGWQMTDVVNERNRVDEWQIAALRSFKLFTDDVKHEQPLLILGDVGTASAPLMMVEASVRWQSGCGLADLAMVAVHSDGPERGAILLARAT